MFRKSQKLLTDAELWASSTEAAYSEHAIAIHSISMVGYVNAVRAIVCFELPAREASNFCDFWKWTSCNFIAFISSLIEVNSRFFRCALIILRINLPNLCPSMNHFDTTVDFSECHSEEVISFFWRSVYVLLTCALYWSVGNKGASSLRPGCCLPQYTTDFYPKGIIDHLSVQALLNL